uniref:Uncharacterized protein n=1 Tax=Pyxicephalus adspersus TaxID=30357 RepID=A0AAV3AIC1_PYXAD|nr:TPA: hypothetical protein GDO54_011273 [Pyxicephalus adspersus]
MVWSHPPVCTNREHRSTTKQLKMFAYTNQNVFMNVQNGKKLKLEPKKPSTEHGIRSHTHYWVSGTGALTYHVKMFSTCQFIYC